MQIKKSLSDKLGIKEGFKVFIQNSPENYTSLLEGRLNEVILLENLTQEIDFIHFFAKSKKELENSFPNLKKALDYNGLMWISWPKKTSKIETDLNDKVVRSIGLENGLVDVKVCAIDEIYSGLKFVYRVKDRKHLHTL